MSKYAILVEAADRNRRNLKKALEAVASATRPVSLSDYSRAFAPWAKELDLLNQHITIDQEKIETAVDAYHDVASHLVKALNWPDDAIIVMPQGSASTQTLIRSPDASKFDIDAVCQVDISRVTANNPVGFFETVGQALNGFPLEKKKRCWRILFNNQPFYLEFTPSVPLANVPAQMVESMSLLFQPTQAYQATALAVVDNPTKRWKTSNPAGFTQWVKDQASRVLLKSISLDERMAMAKAQIAPVPDQEVSLSETLRLAIRLLKRHRDMCVRRGYIDSEFQPISVIIVTLLTSCYEGLADSGRFYAHPIQLLVDLAELMPGLVETNNGQFWVGNPTVQGENFAERWNDDSGSRAKAFFTWNGLLVSDLQAILACTTEDEIRKRVRDVFGYQPESSSSGPGSGGAGSGRIPSPARPPSPPPRTTGLA